MASMQSQPVLNKEELQTVTKLGQKLTESMSRMHKNAMPFCFVNLESASYPITRMVAEKSFTLKRGQTTYSCTDKIIGMVSYYEDLDNQDKSYITLCLNVPGNLLTEPKTELTEDAQATELAGKPCIGYKSCVNLKTPLFVNDTDPDETKYNLYGLGFHLMGTQTYATVSIGPDDIQSSQWHFNMKILHPSPFKEVDEIMTRFYDLMRVRGFLKDESDEEDMGSLADNAGIEW